MAKTEIKTKPTEVSVDAFIDAVANSGQRDDANKIRAMMERLTGEPAKMWGPTIIGFGSYHYRYDSGHEGDMCRIGFSPRKGQTVLYLVDGLDGHAELMARLGKHKTGKSCLYVRKLADIDETVLEELCARSLIWMAEKYPPA
ncbi:MAG: DUF1801 domain-containing protein [Sphingomonadales bacterium]|jgi:hypothetical protein|nr:DUF1801 domain-containing protein [Sphingomonadales bacterium]MBK9002562.1 DUF1801 domain-containing protein [Sphingomonadales bacterium]MBK9267782.1 DUF1801 domain-containing protein [Sphingomonadales bacterium]MBP6433458.1 DUF1801 domain-containing protein [Sphingorhabdus sp.]